MPSEAAKEKEAEVAETRHRQTDRFLMQGKQDSKKRKRQAGPAKSAEQGEYPCPQCGEGVSPLEAVLSPVCGRCVRENHRRALGK